jgi:hypothetical protein
MPRLRTRHSSSDFAPADGAPAGSSVLESRRPAPNYLGSAVELYLRDMSRLGAISEHDLHDAKLSIARIANLKG